LEEQIRDFVRRVDKRRVILDKSVAFNTNLTELWNGYETARNETYEEDVADTLEGAEERVKRFAHHRRALVVAFCNCQKEAKSLLHHLRCASIEDSKRDSSNSISHLESVLRTLSIEQNAFDDFCSEHELRLDFGLQFRYFERDASETLISMENWAEDMNYGIQICISDLMRMQDSSEVEKIYLHENLKSEQLLNRVQQICTKAQELLLQADHSDLSELSCDGEFPVSGRIRELRDITQKRIHELNVLMYKHRAKLERLIRLKRMQMHAEQMGEMIRSCEENISRMSLLINNQQQVQEFHKTHERCCRGNIDKTRRGVSQLQEEVLTLRVDGVGNQELIDVACELDERLRSKWEVLARHDQERTSLLGSAFQFYRKAREVYEALDALKQQYHQIEEWDEKSDFDRMTALHKDQKTRFLQACTYVRKLAKEFQKHIKRSISYHPNDQFVIDLKSASESPLSLDRVITRILEDLLQRENQVLNLWASKHSLLDRCQWYRSVVQNMLVWLQTTGDPYLSSFSSRLHQLEDDPEKKSKMLEDHKELTQKAKNRIEVFDLQWVTLVQEAPQIHNFARSYAKAVKNRYDEFLRCMNIHLKALMSNASNLREEDETSSAEKCEAIGEEIANVAPPSDPADEKLMKKRNFIMKELLETEHRYVQDLGDCINFYMKELSEDNIDVPEVIRNSQDVIFGNMIELHEFHSNIFVKELEKYKQLPEDLGHCFVTWSSKFSLYVKYCQNKPISLEFIVKNAGDFFDQIQMRKQLNESINSYLIKPIQRITKYQLLLKELASCCKSEKSEIHDGLEVMLSVPRKANDALHLTMMSGFNENITNEGDVIVQNSFQVLDTKQLIRKERDRHLFLFELSLIVAKENVDSNGKMKYFFKNKYLLSDLRLQDSNNEADDSCKITICVGRSEKLIIKAQSLKIKQEWKEHLSELIPTESNNFGKFSKRRGIDLVKWPSSSSNEKWSPSTSDSISIMSKESGSGLDSLSIGDIVCVIEDQESEQGDNFIHITRGTLVTVTKQPTSNQLVYVQTRDGSREGFIPTYRLMSPVSDPSSKGSSITDLASLSLRTGKIQLTSTSTLPNEKKSGFRKWLPSSSRKKTTNNQMSLKTTNEQTEQSLITNQITKSPTKLGKKKKASRSVIKPSSVKHLVNDEVGDEDEEITSQSLPPRMQIVGDKLSTDSQMISSVVMATSSRFTSESADIWEKRVRMIQFIVQHVIKLVTCQLDRK